MKPLHHLLEYLETRPLGGITDHSQLEPLLEGCWDPLSGSDQGGMTADKLFGRIENVAWQPPCLTFEIERHGGMEFGSGRAELQTWIVNIEKCTASSTRGKYRQLRPRAGKLDLNPIVLDIVQLIIHRRKDDRLKWQPDDSVRVLIGKILPKRSAVKATLSGRRKRLRTEIDGELMAHGWHKVRENVYALDSKQPKPD